MYSAFVWLALKMVKPDGQVVAIIPRSFCNGTYYKPFREFIIGNVAIEHIHVFESRKEAFSDDSVLQENVVISFRKRSMAASTIISWSMDSSMSDYHEKRVRTEEIIKENDTQKYIHIPIGRAKRHKPDLFSTSFSDLGLSVSTGPIVDFRMKDLLLDDPSGQSVPLMYPVHFRNYKLSWPQKSKKPNAILLSDQVKKNLFHNGNYVLIRRFSSKEERHRVVASILCTDDLENEYFTFENHLNVIHRDREGIDIHLALGLICFLNSDILDTEFRKFSGHTQVNAADIKTIRYPTLKELVKLGIMMEKANEWMQFDLMIKEVING
jgi:adenine-specific DNA-methyltransferase